MQKKKKFTMAFKKNLYLLLAPIIEHNAGAKVDF